MSFYGTVFYEFERLFFKFKFKNAADTIDTVDLNSIDSIDGITATERWDTFHIDGGNRWIKLASMDEGGERKGVTIFHAEAGPAKHSFSTMDLKELDEGESPDVELGIHQAFNIPTLSYDNAGHITGIENTLYRLPEPQQVVTDGMESFFEEDVTLQGFEHEWEFPEEEEAYETLAPGQPVAVTRFLVNDKGVITGTEPVFYKMPASDAEQDFAELDERLSIAEEDIATIKRDYTPLEITGDIQNLYYPTEDSFVVGEDKFQNIVDAIGNIEESGRLMAEDIRQIPSLAEQVKTTYESISALSITQSMSISELTKQLESLTKRVEALENPTS